MMGEMRNAYGILTGKREEKREFGRPRCRWENNTKMHLKELENEGVDCIHVAPNWNQ
jgi:hypothetical protein